MPRRSSGPWYRTSHNAWYATIGGKKVRLDADRERAAERFRALTETSTESGKITVPLLIAAYLADRGPRVRPLTLELYRSHAESFAAVAGTLPASDVQPRHISAWIAGRGIGANTATIARRIVKAIWRWGLLEGHLAADQLGRLVVGTVGRRREVTSEAVAAWVAAVDKPALRDWAEIALATGMRPGEQAGITSTDLYKEHRAIRVAGKTGSRLVYLGQSVLARLEMLAALRPSGPLLLSPSWKRPWTLNSLDYAFRRHSEACGISIVPYDLRHEFASALHRRGVDVLTISRLLGHTTTAMAAKHYVRMEAGPLLAALDRAS